MGIFTLRFLNNLDFYNTTQLLDDVHIQKGKYYINLRSFQMALIVILINLKLLLDTILDRNVLVVNILLYAVFLTSINYRRLRLEFLVVIFFIGLSFVTQTSLICAYVTLLVYVFRDIRLKQLAMWNVLCMFLVLSIVYLGVHLGWIHEEKDVYINLNSLRIRRDLGFGNCNQLAIYCFGFLSSLFLLLKKHRFLCISLFFIIGTIVTQYTDSRTFLLSVIVFFVFYVMQCLGILSIKAYRIFLIIYPLLLLLYTIVLPYNDPHGFFNALSSNRMRLYRDFMDSVGLLDILIGTSSIKDTTIDSTYLHLIFDGGILFFLFFMAFYFFVVFKYAFKLRPFVPLLAAYLTYGAFETFFSNSSNVANIYIWIILFKALKSKKRSVNL